MLKNTQINRIATKTIAKALQELNERVIYVGGAVVSLYIDDPAAEDIRPTKDIDISLRIVSLVELERIREALIKKDFYQTSEDNVMCRFRYDDILIDVMATKEIGWAPGNIWFECGFEERQAVQLDEDRIHILPLPYFLATKFTAYGNRGKNDPIGSEDFEDIVYLLNHVSSVKEQILQGNSAVQEYLKKSFQSILNDDALQEAVLAHLSHEDQMTRSEKILNDLKEIIDAI